MTVPARTLLPFLPVVLCALAAISVPARAESHPRLLFDASDIPALRAKITSQPWKGMFETLLADAESGEYRNYAGFRTPDNPEGATGDAWGESVNAFRCAFLYVLTGDDKWAKKSRTYCEWRLSDTSERNGWANPAVFGLSLSFHGKAVALSYDWCFDAPSWQTATSAADATPFRDHVSRQLLAQADVIATHGGAQQNNTAASNWQGIRGSTALLCYLAGDLPYDAERFKSMFAKTESYVRENVGPDPNSRGWNIEGIGYLGYPWAHVVPAALAAKRNDPKNDLFASTPGSSYTLWTQYAATVGFERPEVSEKPIWILHPDFGDDHATADDANGCFGLAFPITKPSLLPGFEHWYAKVMIPGGNHDHTRAGTIFSILYHPAKKAADPMSIPDWRHAFLDPAGNGFFTYRNRYLDKDDMVAQMYLKLRGNKGHNGPDALSFRILGLNTAWAVGGGRYGKSVDGVDVYIQQMNTLYPTDPSGPVSISSESGKVVGTPLLLDDGSGHVVASISRNNVGATNHKRWFVADHSNKNAGVEAVYLIADTSADGFFWQINTLDEPDTTITTSGNHFTITGRDGSSMRGTVLYPTGDSVITTGIRERGSSFAYPINNKQETGYGRRNRFVNVRGPGDYVVVLTVAKSGQTHPTVSKAAGRVLNSPVTVGGKTYTFEPETVRYDTMPTPVIAPPSVPGQLSAKADPHYSQVELNWVDRADNEDGFILERSTEGEAWVAVQKIPFANVSRATDGNLNPSTSYRYRLRAYHGGGDSEVSNEATATTLPAGHSKLIADDSFESCAIAVLNGQGSGGGWKSAWTGPAVEVIDVSARPLAAAGVHGGNRAIRLPWGENVGLRTFAQAPALQDANPVFLSYLVRWEAGTDGANDTAHLFNTSFNHDWRFLGIARDPTAGDFRVSSRLGDGTNGGPKMVPGEAYLIVCRITPSSLQLWVNPGSENDPPTLTHNHGWSKTTFPGIGLSSKPSPNAFFVMDRIIVAKDFSTALRGAPLPEASP